MKNKIYQPTGLSPAGKLIFEKIKAGEEVSIKDYTTGNAIDMYNKKYAIYNENGVQVKVIITLRDIKEIYKYLLSIEQKGP